MTASDPDPSVGPPSQEDRRDALLAVLVELEHHVGESGWDVPPRLFALVETDALAAAEPALARSLGLRTTADGAAPGALTAIEQDSFVPTDDLLADLDQALARSMPEPGAHNVGYECAEGAVEMAEDAVEVSARFSADAALAVRVVEPAAPSGSSCTCENEALSSHRRDPGSGRIVGLVWRSGPRGEDAA